MKRLSSLRHSDSLTIPSAKKSAIREGKEKDGIPSDTEAGLYYLQGLVPRVPASSPANPLPVVVLKHQIYSIIKDKTTVDREIMVMRNNGDIRLIKLDAASDDYGIIMKDEYCRLINEQLKGIPLLCDKVINSLLPACVDVSVSKSQLIKELSFSDDQISSLVKHGLLLVRDVGRNFLKQLFKRLKNKEILQKDLESKKLSANVLPMEYFIHDIIGSELVESIETSSGPLLRLI